MESNESVTEWIVKVQAGDEEAAQKLWERYFDRLVRLSRKRLSKRVRRVADEEDVALTALNSFFHGARLGHFPDLHDRDNLWRLLVVITANKASQLVEREQRQKRGGPMGPVAASRAVGEIAQIISTEPTPDFAVSVVEQCERLFAQLADPKLQSVTQWKLEGYSNEEIAAKLDCSVRTVERKLAIVRAKWSQQDSRDEQ